MSPDWGYSYKVNPLDEDRCAKASGRDLKVSAKNTREVCNTIKGWDTTKAKEYLEKVMYKKAPVPFRRHNKKVGHRHGMQEFKWHSGRFPIKSAIKVYEVLVNAEANATYKGLDPDNLKIIHSAVQRGRKIKRYIERAHGRSSPYFKQLTHIEIVLREKRGTPQ